MGSLWVAHLAAQAAIDLALRFSPLTARMRSAPIADRRVDLAVKGKGDARAAAASKANF